MTQLVSLDTSFLICALAPRGDHCAGASAFLAGLLESEPTPDLVLTSIVCYELRRGYELARLKGYAEPQGAREFTALLRLARYVELTRADEQLAAKLWATARSQHRQTGPDHALDGDALIAATTSRLGGLILTDNVGHFRTYYPYAYHWTDLTLPLQPNHFPPS